MTDRGRVPFALLGVLLLASSATLAPALSPTQPATQPAVEVGMAEIRSEVTTAVREAAHAAARSSARRPVVAPANTTYGRLLDPEEPFRDSLELRLNGALRRSLADVSGRVRGLSASASIPAITDPATARDALERIEVSRAGDADTAMGVSVAGIDVRLERAGQVVASRTLSSSVTVDTPVLAVHDRVRTFERLLGASPARTGLGRRLTALLYPLTWARGFAQYRGAPLQNVLGNRHVGVLTNSAILDLQRAVFGRADPIGRQVLETEFERVAVEDLLSAATGGSTALSSLNDLRREPLDPATINDSIGSGLAGDNNSTVPAPESAVRIGAAAAADRAFVTIADRVDALVNRTYTATVRLDGRVAWRRGALPQRPTRPGPDWTLVGNETTREETVSSRSAETVPASGPSHVLAAYPRTVRVHVERTAVWQRGTQTRRTTSSSTIRAGVTVRLIGNHHGGPAPVAPIDGAHAATGPNATAPFAGVPEAARDRLLSDGVDSLAARVATGAALARRARIRGDRPSDLSARVIEGLASLRRRLHNVSTATTRGRLATLQVNPAERLAERLRSSRSRFVGSPARYPSVARRAVVGARMAMLETAIERLERRAANTESARSHVASAIEDSGASINTLQAGYKRRADQHAGAGPGLRLRVDAAPAYLTRAEVSHGDVSAVEAGSPEHPLVLSNRNVVSIPYGDAADLLARLLGGRDRVTYRTAARVLRAARRVQDRANASLHVSALRETLTAANAGMELLLAGRLTREHGWPLAVGREIVDEGLARWQDPVARALAYVNGSAAPAIAAAARRRFPDAIRTDAAERVLGVGLRVTLQRARSGNVSALFDALPLRQSVLTDQGASIGPLRGPVNETGAAVRTVRSGPGGLAVDTGASEATRRALSAKLDRRFPHLPAGLPLAPLPGMWFTTVNAWTVRARGSYARFTVRAPRASPLAPAGSLAYVRDGATVAVDVDGDGRGERLGRATRVTFNVSTVVGIAVPPGGTGVGDVDGQTLETSAGWPRPGPE